ncbi:MAG: hypothetical protein AAF141_16115, partial [Pseudomonadota bacterium]
HFGLACHAGAKQIVSEKQVTRCAEIPDGDGSHQTRQCRGYPWPDLKAPDLAIAFNVNCMLPRPLTECISVVMGVLC